MDLVAAAISALVIILWLTYRTALPHTHEDYGARLAQPWAYLKNLPHLPGILKEFAACLFDVSRAGVIWYLLILTAVLCPRALQRTAVRVLWCLLLIQMALYVATFVVTLWDLPVLIPMITPKLQAQASAIAAVLIAMNLRDMRWPEKTQV